MLHKPICERCFFKHLELKKSYGVYTSFVNVATPEEYFDSKWNNSLCPCPIISNWCIHDKPPADCPYYLEHIVNEKELAI